MFIYLFFKKLNLNCVLKDVEILKASGRGTNLWMDCMVFSTTGDLWLGKMGAGGRGSGGGGGGGAALGQIGEGFSSESEHDLAMMVSEFLENGSGSADSRCSSDSESGFSDLALLCDKVSVSLYYLFVPLPAFFLFFFFSQVEGEGAGENPLALVIYTIENFILGTNPYPQLS